MINYTVNKIKNYQFFDGKKLFEVQDTYDDFLTSAYYESLVEAYILVGGQKINLLQNRKSISSFQNNHFTNEDIITLAEIFDMRIEKRESYLYLIKSFRFGDFELTENEKYLVIFCVENYKEPEHIFIYGVWEKLYNTNTKFS
jgi:hypothetical protein